MNGNESRREGESPDPEAGDQRVREYVSYPLTLAVQYERGKAEEAGADGPTGFAVISLGGFVVHKEPLRLLTGEIVDRLDLEEAAAGWLERATCEAAAR